MKCYVINLSERPERLAHMRQTMSRGGIRFERFEAIGPGQFGDYPLATTLRPKRDGRCWLPLEVGCLLSHHELWKKVAAAQDPFACIFEDDLLISGRLRDILDGPLPPDAGLVKLETFCEMIYVRRGGLRMPGGGRFKRLLTPHEGTGAYIISRAAAAKLVDAAAEFDAPVDTCLFSPTRLADEGLAAYQAVPALAIQGMFVQGLRDSPVMTSTRQGDLDSARTAPLRRTASNFLKRMVVRLWRQLRGQRLVVPFDDFPAAALQAAQTRQ